MEQRVDFLPPSVGASQPCEHGPRDALLERRPDLTRYFLVDRIDEALSEKGTVNSPTPAFCVAASIVRA